ncbi:MAG TPA: sodium:proton antiporter [Roseiarcus sp.]|nr:sodium:proton antiporter [Roseiarcus sp.]
MLASTGAAEAAPLDGARLSLGWAVPFLGLLISIGLGPLLAENFWHRHYGKIAFVWAAGLALALAFRVGFAAASEAVADALVADYLPFILMMFALYVTAGGVVLRAAAHGRPAINTLLLAIGTVAASFIGVTAASMIMIRPLLHSNYERTRKAHVVVFFIFLVANIGGALTPLGNPPLFFGFINGVDFFWPAVHQWPQTLFATAVLLALFFAIDAWLLASEPKPPRARPHDIPTRFKGAGNLLLLALAVAAIVAGGLWNPGRGFAVFGVKIAAQDAARDLAMIVIGLASLTLTDRAARAANGFEWAPLAEVAKLFAAIFVCIVPLFAILDAGRDGALAWLIDKMALPGGAPDPVAYFWFTGLISAALDNAPTYLVAFNLAGGDPIHLMGAEASTLKAIGLGAAFMGALTYIGNAPNFMIYAMARRAGFAMPSFFGYMASAAVLLAPVFVAVSFML